jgi:transposase-like protein
MLSESKFLAFYRRQHESGLSVREFCSNEGIATSTFYYWYKKLRVKGTNKNFIPLVVKPASPASHHSYNKNQPSVQEDRNIEDNLLLEVVYPNGTRLRITQDLDLDHLRTLVCLLD